MKVLIIALMFIVTLFAIYSIEEKGTEVKVGDVTASRYLSKMGCVTITIVAVVYDLTSIYLLMCGV